MTSAISWIGCTPPTGVQGLTGVGASTSGGNVTVTANSGQSLVNARYGVEYGDGAGGVYQRSKNVVGTALNQTITIGLLDGVISGHTLSYRPYFNLTDLDPPSGRHYGTAGTIAVP